MDANQDFTLALTAQLYLHGTSHPPRQRRGLPLESPSPAAQLLVLVAGSGSLSALLRACMFTVWKNIDMTMFHQSSLHTTSTPGRCSLWN